MTILDISLAVFLLLFAFYLTQVFKHRGKNLPPGPLGLPIVGYLPFLNPSFPHLSFTNLSFKFGPIYSIQLGSIFTDHWEEQLPRVLSVSMSFGILMTLQTCFIQYLQFGMNLTVPLGGLAEVVLTDVKLVRQALALESLSGRAPLYLTHGIMKGNGIICVQGEKWKEQRKFVASCLRNFGMVKFGEKRHKMENDIKKGVSQLLNKLKQTEGTPIDLGHLLMHSLGNVVFNLVFGKTWEEEDKTWKELINLQEEGTKLIGVAGPINFLPFLRFLPKYKKIIKYIENGITYSHDIYQRILEEYRKTSPDAAEDSHFLSCFNKEMSKRENNKTFYTSTQFNYLMADLWGAGVDTTITTLRWFFLYIAHHTEYQEKIQKEMDEVLGTREISLDDVQFLPYFQACLSEVQRIRSVTPLGIPHGATEDCYLNDYYIPKGTMIIPLQWAIHMNPKLYPDPDVYNPNRFLTDDGKYTKPDAFIPFQTGKRTCVGEEYARMLLFLYAGTVLQNFTLLLENRADFEGEVGITLTPKPHKIKFLFRIGQI